MMRVYEGTLSFSLVQEGTVEALDAPEKVARYMEGAFDDPTTESFWVIPMSTKNRPMGRVLVTKGTATASLVHPREVFRPAILAGATALVCIHNHPSGDPAPSQADIRVTRQLKEAGRCLDLEVLDHIVLGHAQTYPPGYFSFLEAGYL